MKRMIDKKVDVDRIYLPHLEGGKASMFLGKEYQETMVGLGNYMIEKDDPQITDPPQTSDT